VLDTMGDNAIFGEMALVDPAPRSATAIAVTNVKLVPVAEKQFLFLVSRTPHFALNVMRILARRLRAANSAM
jgi:CRP-like cAMP-binding protein